MGEGEREPIFMQFKTEPDSVMGKEWIRVLLKAEFDSVSQVDV